MVKPSQKMSRNHKKINFYKTKQTHNHNTPDVKRIKNLDERMKILDVRGEN